MIEIALGLSRTNETRLFFVMGVFPATMILVKGDFFKKCYYLEMRFRNDKGWCTVISVINQVSFHLNSSPD